MFMNRVSVLVKLRVRVIVIKRAQVRFRFSVSVRVRVKLRVGDRTRVKGTKRKHRLHRNFVRCCRNAED